MAKRARKVVSKTSNSRRAPVNSRITSVADLVKKISSMPIDDRKVRVFRGHSKQTYSLKPSLYRNIRHAKDEKNIFRELISMHPNEFQSDRSVFEQLVRMQHYQLETRLLDVSYNPLVALYFAVCSNKEADGDLIIFETTKSRVKYYDSDAVSCIANLSNLTATERNELRKISDQSLLNESDPGMRLLQFIKAEKPYFLPLIKPDDLSSVFLVKPRLNNRRILAQQGAFFIFSLSYEIDTTIDNISFTKLTVPASAKASILRQLDLININKSTMFPEIEYAAKYIMDKLTPIDAAGP